MYQQRLFVLLQQVVQPGGVVALRQRYRGIFGGLTGVGEGGTVRPQAEVVAEGDDAATAHGELQRHGVAVRIFVCGGGAAVVNAARDRGDDVQGAAVARAPGEAVAFFFQRLPFQAEGFARRMAAFQHQEAARCHPFAQAGLLGFWQIRAVVFQQQRVFVCRGKRAARAVGQFQFGTAFAQEVLCQRVGAVCRRTRPAAPDLFPRAAAIVFGQEGCQRQQHDDQRGCDDYSDARFHTPCHSAR